MEEQKSKLEFSIKELDLNNKKTVITEDILRQLFDMFKSYVAEKNIPEIKKFIGSYVEKVIVYKEHVDVIYQNCGFIRWRRGDSNPRPKTAIHEHLRAQSLV